MQKFLSLAVGIIFLMVIGLVSYTLVQERNLSVTGKAEDIGSGDTGCDNPTEDCTDKWCAFCSGDDCVNPGSRKACECTWYFGDYKTPLKEQYCCEPYQTCGGSRCVSGELCKSCCQARDSSDSYWSLWCKERHDQTTCEKLDPEGDKLVSHCGWNC